MNSEQATLLTTKDVAARLGISPLRVRQRRLALAARGVEVGRRLGREWIYREDEVELIRPGRPGRP